MKNFAIVGAAGFVAPRHLKAIHDTGNRLLAAADPHDAVGVLDRFFSDARLLHGDRAVRPLPRKAAPRPEADRVHYVSICSPNYLHDAHVRLALRSGPTRSARSRS